MEYTKAPWEYEPDNTDYQDKNRAGCYAGNIVGGDDELNLCILINDCLEDKVKANAHLVAAAPDMYEALNTLQNWGGYGQAPMRIRNMIYKALAKAEKEGE